eukprot:c20091_g1_i1.p1 GENE.c20091_g1_i1~~c20091_g1_i1.p1  ORF type:complete len:755 (+),score=355.57 c20091_g1_i1:24-2267(+)
MANKKVQVPDTGVVFPLDDKGGRSTTDTGKKVFAAALKGVDQAAEQAVLNERSWRFKYAKHVVENVRVSARSPKIALQVAQNGLEFVHNNFQFVRDGKTLSVKESMEMNCGTFITAELKGSQAPPKHFDLQIPYNGKNLTGDDALIQVEQWAKYGTIELSAAQAISQVIKTRKWLDLSDKYFVLLGALSAMGPLRVLLSLGANVIAVDLNRPVIWKNLFDITDKSCGTLIFPVSKSPEGLSREQLTEVAGADLINSPPEIKNWLLEVKKDKDLVIGCYAYLDSDLFVRLSVAMDAIVGKVMEKRKNVAVAYLCTPTDCHLITAPAYHAEVSAFKKEALWMTLLRVLSGSKVLHKNARNPFVTDDGQKQYYVDAIVINQGPNYILAKRIQHWRAIVAREINKSIVSSNVAPSTATLSVVSNRSFAWAYNGMHNFKPMEVFKQETSNAVMTALLINDLRNPTSAANPNVELQNPLNLFTETSFHGGVWRTAHKFTTIGVPSALLYFLSLIVSAYLVLYNSVQTAGWGFALYQLFNTKFGANKSQNLWDATGYYVSFFQFLALLEVVHSFIGVTTAPVFHSLIQIFSRLLLVGIVSTNPTVQNSDSLYVMLFAWCLTEVVRYGYFALKQSGFDNYLSKFLRYSLFIVLYPLGVGGEIFTAYGALPTIHATLASASLETADHATALYISIHRLIEKHLVADVSNWISYVIFPSYLFGLPFLYLYMLSQRKKVLGGSNTTSSGKQTSKPKKD